MLITSTRIALIGPLGSHWWYLPGRSCRNFYNVLLELTDRERRPSSLRNLDPVVLWPLCRKRGAEIEVHAVSNQNWERRPRGLVVETWTDGYGGQQSVKGMGDIVLQEDSC